MNGYLLVILVLRSNLRFNFLSFTFLLAPSFSVVLPKLEVHKPVMDASNYGTILLFLN